MRARVVVVALALGACKAEPAPPPQTPVTELEVPPMTTALEQPPPPPNADPYIPREPPPAPEPEPEAHVTLAPLGGPPTASFDRIAAATALRQVPLQSCRRRGWPTGSGHVTITFDPNGTVGSAVVDQGPYPGTAAGTCIAMAYRTARIPPYNGVPVRIGKSFVLP